ncbi:MAG: hypothetical protein P8P74_01225 [Crocinitomicaceae bacterium]|nr:hypothetical protein [Crocinitomicaceae bacterium]
MGIFDKFKRTKQETKPSEYKADASFVAKDNEWKMILVDGLYLLDVPSDWEVFPSDRFRMKNQSDSIQFSATNFGKSRSESDKFSINDLINESKPMFEKFVTEGGYEPINEMVIGDNFVFQAFKVDHETQYYFYTYGEVPSNLIRMNFILREASSYQTSTRDKFLKIGQSVKWKVA